MRNNTYANIVLYKSGGNMKGIFGVRYSDYLDEFKCIGGKCEDTCCKEWSVYVDKDTYEKYDSIKDNNIRKFVTDNITIRKNYKNEKFDYGVIKLRENKKCPFLDEEKFCSIQRCFGDEYLSNVCSAFPRIITRINGGYEISLNISCIEAARIVLLREEKINFIYGRKQLDKFQPLIEIDTRGDLYNNTNGHYLIPIRKLSINIIQNRNHNIYERLYILGSSLEYISKKLTYNFNSFNMVLDEYENNLHEIFKTKNRDNMDYMMQIVFFKNIIEIIKGWNDEISRRIKIIINKAEEGFKFSDGRSLMDKQYIYVRAYKIVEDNIKDRYSHIFENYLANFMFQSFFPFSESDDMMEDYIFISMRFSLIVFLIVGNYLYDSESLDEKFIVHVMHLLAKDIDHNEKGIKEIYTYLRKNGLFNLRFARTLL